MEGTDEGPDGGTGSRLVRRAYDWTRTAPSIAIVETIAEVEGIDPVGLSKEEGFVLANHVDPDALDALVPDEQGGANAITVSLADYTVRIDGDELLVTHLRDIE